MKKFLLLLSFLLIILGGGWFYLKTVRGRTPASAASALPGLPTPAREYRFGVLGRPSELVLHALTRMPELQGLPLKFIPCSSPAQRWLMLSSGQVDTIIASSDELALELPGYSATLNCFPIAMQNGNEQVVASKDPNTPPWVAYLPGGISQSLALDLKDPQLKLLSLQNPETATAMLKAGQIRACSLWNPYLEQARVQGFEVKGQPSSSFEVWVSSPVGVETGRISQEDQADVVQAWFDLMHQLVEQPELTQRAIAEENELPAVQIPMTLKGLQFYSAASLLSQRSQLTEALRLQLRDKVNLWSLAGLPVSGDLKRLQLDLEWLDSLNLKPEVPLESPETPAAPDTTTPTPTSFSPGGDPFSRPSPGTSLAAITQAGGDASHSGRLPGPPLLSQPKQLWNCGLGAEPTSTVIASPDGNQLFVGLADGNLCCVERSSGRLLWKYSLGERIRSTPACHAQWVEAASDAGVVASINRSDGQKNWQIEVGSDVVGPLTEENGVLFLATYSGTITAIDVSDGSSLWNQETGTNITAGLAIAEDRVIACGLDHKVRAFNKANGKSDWITSLGDACRATPCVESGLIAVGCGDHKVYGLRYSDGSIAWKQPLPDEVTAAPVALGKNLWLGCKDNNIYCLDRASGKQISSFPTRERITNDLIGSENTIYAVSQDMRLYALNSNDGKLRFKHKEAQWLLTPWLQDATIYLAVTDGNLKALK